MKTSEPTTILQQIIDVMDNYHERGEFHEYTPLEKERHANQIINILEQAKTEARIGEVELLRHNIFTDSGLTSYEGIDEYTLERLANLKEGKEEL